MTTIAFDGKILAADGLCTVGNAIQGRSAQKIFPVVTTWNGEKVPALFAGAGSLEALWIVKGWLESDDLLNSQTVPPLKTEEFEGLLVLADGQCFSLESSLIPFPSEAPAVCGSGSQFAQAAMLVGKSATEAVEVASQLDIYTGGTISYYDVASIELVETESHAKAA